MIHINIQRMRDGKISSFMMDGHANFAEKGQDIVCAGVSAVAFGSLNAIIALTGVDLEVEQSDSGFLECSIPTKLPEETTKQVQLLLEGMIVSLKTIEREYQDHIKITIEK